MNQPMPSTPSDESKPLISSGLLRKAAICIAAMGALTLALSIVGRMIGERMVMSGHSIDPSPVAISLNGNTIVLPANTIRFDNQRVGGVHERIDAYFTWPDLEGYTHANRRHFNDIDNSQQLVFLALSARTMPMDMSARLEPVYSRLTDGGTRSKESGLLAYAFEDDTRYAGEILYVGARNNDLAFAARCLKENGMPSGSHSCMRDINVGPDLTVTYRFSRKLLPEWRRLDAAIKAYVMDSFNPSESHKSS
ncbi:MAG: hypothetical protein GY789_01935 [Hyphomicrobiales bacterium]|nr:hypothetical protein [Hyphomicrobiales bacterium]MCP5000319.1 hypothetical protein [Hyphomicrobiales bacterium]